MNIQSIKVENMESARGLKVPNQFIIRTTSGTYFKSYLSTIVYKDGAQTYLDKNKWDYSTTTGKYRNIFLGEKKAETLKKIKSGVYKLADLNY